MGYKLNVTSNVWVDIGAQPSCMHGWFGSTVSLVKAKLTPFCVSKKRRRTTTCRLAPDYGVGINYTTLRCYLEKKKKNYDMPFSSRLWSPFIDEEKEYIEGTPAIPDSWHRNKMTGID
ncbi:hypothetical protein QE152_g28394 [Popillia japonica]|uniref:Uncharacterized protein n=1 Tax=Popillia japonica TaxID=7064 RepID=A0AAW1JJP4_POPJA